MTHIVSKAPLVGFAVALLALSGCAGPGPKLFPTHASENTKPETRTYDLDQDGRDDFLETLNDDGRVVSLARDKDNDGVFEHRVVLTDIPSEERHEFFLLLDSIPHALVAEAWEQGRFRYFHPPSRVIAPFPVMTDLSIAEFFGISPCPGLESEYFDGKRLQSGYMNYASGKNTPWHAFMDYTMWSVLHGESYSDPLPWYGRELRRIQEEVNKRSDQPRTRAYVVGTSAIGASLGEDGHRQALDRLDRYCQQLIADSDGRTRITLMSDHGHAFVPSQRIPLDDILREQGYRVGKTLEKPQDVVIPQFGIVTYAAIHTTEPAQVAKIVLGVEGVELAIYPSPDRSTIYVLNKDGRSTIEANHESDAIRYKYSVVEADPLNLQRAWASLRTDEQGYVSDHELFEATKSHEMPDAVARIWRAFHGLVENVPQLIVTTRDGYHCGSAYMSRRIDLIGAHGNLRTMSSTGFLMTMAGELPEVMRMSDACETLAKRGVTLK